MECRNTFHFFVLYILIIKQNVIIYGTTKRRTTGY
jgi:hypothetical protein